MTSTGKLIIFEAGEGAGKSTQSNLLTEALKDRLGANRIVHTREPGGTPAAEHLRDLIKQGFGDAEAMHDHTELMLINAARAQHMSQVIAPNLKKGNWVVCDRGWISTLAYQCWGRGIARDQVLACNELGRCGVNADLTVFLSISPEAGMERAKSRGALDRIELAGDDFMERVNRGFHFEMNEIHPSKKLVLDATNSIESIHSQILDRVARDFHVRNDVETMSP